MQTDQLGYEINFYFKKILKLYELLAECILCCNAKFLEK